MTSKEIKTLLKAKNNGFYIKYKGFILTVFPDAIDTIDLIKEIIGFRYNGWLFVRFNEYGIKWALTKEELENGKTEN